MARVGNHILLILSLAIRITTLHTALFVETRKCNMLKNLIETFGLARINETRHASVTGTRRKIDMVVHNSLARLVVNAAVNLGTYEIQ